MVSQSSARYRRYQTKTIFQQMASIRGTLPKGLPAHVVFIPNTYLIFRGAVRLTKPFVEQDYLLRSWKNVGPEARRRAFCCFT